MDNLATQNEIRLHDTQSRQYRLTKAGGAAVVLLFGVIALTLANHVWVILLLPGSLILFDSFLRSDVIWIVTAHGIMIGKKRPLGRLRIRMVKRDDISDVHVRKDNAGRCGLAFKLVSGQLLVSPPIDVTRVHDTSLRIARRFGLPEVAPPGNPLDATNPDFCIGQPIRRVEGQIRRIMVLMVAVVFGFPYASALRDGASLSAGAIALWSLGLIIVLAICRYAHRLSGTFWIIGHGKFRVEGIALNGQPYADTFIASDVKTIDISTRSEDGYSVDIRLRSGRVLHSPQLPGKDQARAAQSEIVRRLRMEPQTGQR